MTREQMPYPLLSKPPIVEALLDFQVEQEGTLEAAALAGVHDRIRDLYPVSKERMVWQMAFGPGAGSTPPPSPQVDGYFFRSADDRQVVQARLDGFSFSRLHPYERWERFRDEARLRWGDYVAALRPRRVKRIGLRFINRIELPRETQDLQQYFQTAPHISAALPQTVAGLLMRLVLRPTGSAATVIITEALDEAGMTDTTLPFILDIDTFVEGNFVVGDEELWTVLETLRGLKNDAFFGSITKKTEGFFQ